MQTNFKVKCKLKSIVLTYCLVSSFSKVVLGLERRTRNMCVFWGSELQYFCFHIIHNRLISANRLIYSSPMTWLLKINRTLTISQILS